MISSPDKSKSYQELDNLIKSYIQTESALKTITNKETLGYKKREYLLIAHDTDIFKILYSEYEKNHQMQTRVAKHPENNAHGYNLNKNSESDFKDNFLKFNSETNDIALNVVIARYQDLFKPYQGSSSLVPVKQTVSPIIKENPPELPKKSSSNHADNWFAPFSDPLNQLFTSLSQNSQATTIPSSPKPNEDWHTQFSTPLVRLFNPEHGQPTPRNANSLPSTQPKPDNDWHAQLSAPIVDFFKLGNSKPANFSPSKTNDQPITQDWFRSLFSPTATPPALGTIPDFSQTTSLAEPKSNPKTANPSKKPNTHEEAIKMAEEATRNAQREAIQAWGKMEENPQSRALQPTRTSAPTQRAPSSPLKQPPTRTPPTLMPGTSSLPAKQAPRITPSQSNPEIAFFGPAAENHAANPRKDQKRNGPNSPTANGPSKANARSLLSPQKLPRKT